MRLVTVEHNGRELACVLSPCGKKAVPISAFGLEDMTMLGLIRASAADPGLLGRIGEELGQAAQKNGLELASLRLLAPIPRPEQDVICLGINYMEHAEESARFKKEAFDGTRPYAVYFSKRVSEAVPDGGFIQSHPGLVDSLDYEAELAVILGRDAKGVAQEDAAAYVFGYTILNDVSARNVQNRHKQWYFGKSLDGFTPMGPWIVTRDELEFPPARRIQCLVNGEVRQSSDTGRMIFDIPYVISELSQGMTLRAGTIISTGTPSGAGMGFDPPRFLKPGDQVECRIDGIGRLVNEVR